MTTRQLTENPSVVKVGASSSNGALSSNGSFSARNGAFSASLSQTVGIGTVAKRLGISISYARLLSNQGILSSTRMNGFGSGSHRRFNLNQCVSEFLGEEIQEELGDDSANENNPIPIAIYARVSSGERATGFHKDGLDSENPLVDQVNRLKDFCLKEYGREPETLSIFADCASGISFTRKKLNELIVRIINGEFDNGILACTYWDRIARISINLIKTICDTRNIRIVCSEGEETKDDESSAISIGIAVMQCVCSSVSGMKSSKLRKVNIDPEILKKALTLQSQQKTYRQITEILEKDGCRDSRNRIVKLASLRRSMMEYAKISDEFLIALKDQTVEKFILEKLVINQSDKSKTNRIQFIKLEEIYLKWCIQNELVALSRGKLVKEFNTRLVNKLISGSRMYLGVSVKED